MKASGMFALLACIYALGFAQNLASPSPQKSRKGDFYVFWGWNRGWFTTSNITFTGNNYDFTLQDVVARDRQSKFEAKVYFNPGLLTIPQYDSRLGYFVSDHFSVSLGVDHMKYVMRAYQVVKILGKIDGTNTQYDGNYNNEDITLSQDFLQFEHTDGLNYVNADCRRFDELFATKHVSINVTEGVGVGFLLPKTNTTLLNNARYDEFHLAGYGVSGVTALNVEFYKHFFIQTELKGGYINMPDIRTTMSPSDRAHQHFLFGQWNVVFGATFGLKK